MKPIFKECTTHNDGSKILLNLALAQSITPSEYKNARAIVSFLPNPTEEVCYYVTETYEELKKAIEVGMKANHDNP